MKNGIILGGNIIVDELKDIDVYPAHSNLTTIRAKSKACGGLVCNCGLDLAILDPEMPVRMIGIVGDDENGKFVRDSFAKHKNIDVTGMKIEGETAFTDAMCDLKNKTRTFFTYRGSNAKLSPEDFDFDKIKGDLLHIGYILLLDELDCEDDEYGTKMARVLADAKAHGIKTSIDVVSEEGDRFKKLVAPALKYTDYCIINESEAEKITGIKITVDGEVDDEKVKQAQKALFEIGVSEWVIIHAKKGSWGMTKDGKTCKAASLNLPREMIKGTTGAGDAFAAGTLYGAYTGLPIEEAMKTGIAVSNSSILAPGASEGIMSYEDSMKFYNDTIAKYGTME